VRFPLQVPNPAEGVREAELSEGTFSHEFVFFDDISGQRKGKEQFFGYFEQRLETFGVGGACAGQTFLERVHTVINITARQGH
jgi:hypothetical protein